MKTPEEKLETKRRCKREYMRRWRRKPENKAKVLERDRKHHRQRYDYRSQLLIEAKDTGCMDCSKRYPPYVMDFDHVRGTKSFHIGRSHYNVSIERLAAELDKCDVVCSNCHRERTHQRKVAKLSRQ